MRGRPDYFRRIVVAAATALTCLVSSAAAMEGGQSAYLKGYRDFLTGVVPSQGVQFRHDLYIYNGTERTTIPQGQLTLGVRQVSNVFGLTVVTPYRILGGDYAFAIRGGVTDLDVNQSVLNRFGITARRSGELTSLNDVVINPIVIGWHAGNFHWNVLAAVFLPAGNYDKTRLANTGKNVWAVSPQFGVTYLDPKTGWEASGAAIYLNSFTNTDTNYRSGDIVHLDFAAGRNLTRAFKLGVVGYYAQQLRADSGAGANLGSRRLRVAGIGPGITYTFRLNETVVNLVAKYYREFGAQNTTQGDSGTLSLRVKF
ncbi:MAG: transporter [Pseudolabrys sp.]|nr:transporter [Pseudolabrys sp.]